LCGGGGGGGRDRELIVSFEATHQQSVEPLRELGVARELDLQQLATEVQQQTSLALERHLGALEVVYAAGFLVLYRTRMESIVANNNTIIITTTVSGRIRMVQES